MNKLFVEHCVAAMIDKKYMNVKIIDGYQWNKYATFGIEWSISNGDIKRAWTIMDLPIDILELESVCNWSDLPINDNIKIVRLC